MKPKWMMVLVAQMFAGSLVALQDSSQENRGGSPAAQYCTNLNPQTELDIEQIMGLWYGSEVITHIGNDEGETIYDTCVVIHLADITNTTTTTGENQFRNHGQDVRFETTHRYPGDRYNADGNQRYPTQTPHQQYSQHNYQQQQQQQNVRYLRLIWDEKESTLDYTLRFNASRPGFWTSSAPQSGSMVQLPYIQFSGTIQVLKAINNQLVLTFCQSLPGGQLFSVVLSRQPMGLSPEENHSIRNLLRRRNLSTTAVRKVCYNGAASRAPFGIVASIFLALLLHCFTKRN